jgi:O-antigen/teichoic acid export membrane protein
MVTRNIIANYVGTAWSALMGFLFVPWYIKYLGAEAYGVVGISVILQSYLAFLDLGLTPMMGREMARFTAGAHDARAIRSLLRTIELVMWSTSAVAVLSLWLAADWIASEWLRSESLPTADIAHALRILAAVVGMRFLEGLYKGCLIGLQLQVTANVITSTAATLRGAGAVAVLAWWSPTLNAFFWWQGAVSFASLTALAFGAHRLLPAAPASIRQGIKVLRGTWKFAGGMLLSSLLVLLLTQTDKVLLTRLLSLADYGKYTLSLAIASGVSIAAGPIGQAIYPRLNELHAKGKQSLMAETLHRGAQLVTAVAGSICGVLVTFTEEILRLWTGDLALVASTAPTIRLLALGCFVNATMTLPYLVLLTSGRTRFLNAYSAASVVLTVPALCWLVPRYGTAGAAGVWLGLNVLLFATAAPISLQLELRGEVRRWYLADVALPASAITAVCAAGRLAHLLWSPSGLAAACLMAIVGGLTAAAALAATPDLRRMAGSAASSLRRKA